MSQKKVAEVLLKYSVDDPSLKRAVAANDAIKRSMEGIVAAAKQFNLGAEQVANLGQAAGLSAQEIATLNQQLGLLDSSELGATQGAQAQGEALRKLATDADAAEKKVGALASRLEQAAKVRSFQGDATGGLRDAAFGAPAAGGNAGLVSALGSARAAAIALPGIGYQSPLVVGIRALGLVTEKTGASVGQLATGLGIAGVAAIAVAVAFDRFNQQLEESKKQLTGALAAQKNYYDALQNLTSDQVTTQIEQLRNARPILEQQAAEAQKALESAFRQAQQTPLGDVGARAFFNQLPTGDLKAAYDDATKALQENIQTETRLTQGRNAGAFAANDARAAEEQLADIRKKNSEQVVNRVGQDLLDQAATAARAQTLTKEQREKELADLSVQITSNDAYRNSLIKIRDTLDPTTAAYAGYQQAIDGLETQNTKLIIQYNILDSATNTAADGVATFNAAIEDQLSIIQSSIAYNQQLSEQIRTSTVDQVTDRLYGLEQEAAALRTFIPELEKLAPTSKEAADQLAVARDRLTQIGEDYADQMIRVLPSALLRAQQALQAEIDDILAKSGERINQIRADEADKEADAFSDRTKAYLAAQEKRDEALADLAEQQAQKRAEIERKANATIANAIYARNALAAYQAIQQKKQDLADLDENGKARQKEIEKQYEKEKRIADERYRDQLQAAQDAARKAIAVEQQKAQQEIAAKVAAYNAQLSALSVFTNQGTQLVYDFVNNSLQALSQLANTPTPGIIETPGSFSPLPPPSGYQPAPPPTYGWGGRGYATGGYAQPDVIQVNETGIESAYDNRSKRLLLLTEPMRIFSPRMTNRMLNSVGGGLTINVPIQGTQLLKRDIVRVADETLYDRLTKAGFR